MAAPVVAGSAALVRQYFTDGFYPTGAKEPGNAFTPSGVLVKAALMGGAINMLGNTEVRGSLWCLGLGPRPKPTPYVVLIMGFAR